MKTRINLVATALLAVALAAGCASTSPLPQSEFGTTPAKLKLETRRVDSITYTPAEWPEALQGDLHLPNSTGPHPAVLVVHGGGWSSRTRDDMSSIAETLAQRGYAAFNISHRFAPEYRFPAQIHDLQQAVQWMRTNAARYDIDPARIGGFGYSSGAHLIAMIGTLSPGDALFEPGTRLQAMVLGAAPTDLRRYDSGDLVPRFLGTTHSEGYATFVAASPVVYVSADDPPTFGYHGAADLLVTPNYAQEFQQALEAVGVPHRLRIEQLKGHVGMFLLDGNAVDDAIDFLDQVLRGAKS